VGVQDGIRRFLAGDTTPAAPTRTSVRVDLAGELIGSPSEPRPELTEVGG
jgi:hypothetical protein